MLNSVVLIGRLVADPELKYTPNSVPVCHFRIAVDRQFKSQGGESQADFLNIVAWRQSAEFAAQYLHKGRLVAVQGRIQSRSWVQQDGQKRYSVEVVADNVQGLDKPRDQQGQQGAPQQQAPPPADQGYGPADAGGADFGADADFDPFAEE